MKQAQTNPTACGVWDETLMYSKDVADVTCDACREVIDMRPA